MKGAQELFFFFGGGYSFKGLSGRSDSSGVGGTHRGVLS